MHLSETIAGKAGIGAQFVKGIGAFSKEADECGEPFVRLLCAFAQLVTSAGLNGSRFA
jgi:hypothetical protein